MRFRLLLTAVLLTACVSAHADTYSYAFTFTNLTSGNNPNVPIPSSYSVTINEPSLINTTGAPALGYSISTPFGYDVNYFGENSYGGFVFDKSPASISDAGIGFGGTTFVFGPTVNASNYFGVGTFAGFFVGNAPYEVDGSASLTITDLTPQPPAAVTPEPSSLMLLGTGMLGLAGATRRRFRQN